MKLNNKGISLMEILISIVLIGIVLVFLFQLLVDLRNETKNNDFAFNNQVNRSEVINTIQKDLDKYLLKGIKSGSADYIKLSFEFKKGDKVEPVIAELTTDTNYVYYKSVDGIKYKWKMKDATISPCGYFIIDRDSSSNKYYFKLNIQLYTVHENNSKDRNNPIDDIEITYTGYHNNLISNSDYISGFSGEKPVGKCS